MENSTVRKDESEPESEAAAEVLLDTLKSHVENFLNDTQAARAESERDRDYYCHQQWTQEEAATIKRRFGRDPITNNRIKPKIEGLKGVLVQRRTDPRAYPRTQHEEKAAEAITDGLRYVSEHVRLDETELNVAENIFIEGYGGAIVEVNDKGDIEINDIPWDRIYYDTHSRRRNYSDARYMGIILWLDRDEAEEMFPDKEDIIDAAFISNPVDETFEDRPRWTDLGSDETGRKRLRIAQEFFVDDGVWKMAYFTSSGFLVEPAPSPYLDEDGEPANPIELQSAYVDRNNNRFGEVRYWRDLQDEINHRRSKALYLLSVRQTASRKGAIKDVSAMKRELKKPDGHVEYDGSKGEFEVLQTGDMSQGQMGLLAEAKQEIDAVSFNAQLSGERQGDLSGKAVSLLQSAGTLELSSLYDGITGWKLRIYRQIWARMKQHWKKEKWVRILDDQKELRWVGLNTPMTLQDVLEERINDESLPLPVRQAAADAYTKAAGSNPDSLKQIVEVRNPVAKMDVDIILEEAPHSINVQQEQFALLAELAKGWDPLESTCRHASLSIL